MSSSNENIIQIIEDILSENLGEDYEDLERPDYDAMLYTIRNIKEVLDESKWVYCSSTTDDWGTWRFTMSSDGSRLLYRCF